MCQILGTLFLSLFQEYDRWASLVPELASSLAQYPRYKPEIDSISAWRSRSGSLGCRILDKRNFIRARKRKTTLVMHDIFSPCDEVFYQLFTRAYHLRAAAHQQSSNKHSLSVF